MTSPDPALFSPFQLRGLQLKNRIVISPMCMYSAPEVVATDFHLGHYQGLAMGGAGLVIIEATAVSPEGRITHGDLGLWDDAQIAPLARVVAAMRSMGAKVGIQLGHAGRKASRQRPWYGNGPLTDADFARGDLNWPLVSASALPLDAAHPCPSALDGGGIAQLRQQFVSAARRAVQAGVDLVEIHAAHGFLLHSFMSPLSNLREDGYNGDFAARHRLVLEVTSDLRSALPDTVPLSVRISMHDGADGGRPFDETLSLARALAGAGADLIDCSTGGIGGAQAQAAAPAQGYNLPDTQRVRAAGGLPTIAVGLITDPLRANAAVLNSETDLVAIGREALWNRSWPHHARAALNAPDFADWPVQYGWWLERRQPLMAKIAGK